MKRLVTLLAALLMFAGMIFPVYGAQSDFVPSVSRPEKPEIGNVVLIDRELIGTQGDPEGKDQGDVKDYGKGEAVGQCIIISSVQDAEEKRTDISQDERDILVGIYEDLSYNNMNLPLEQEYVVVELLDVSWEYCDCVQVYHTHEEDLRREDSVLVIDFELGVAPDAEVTVLVYIEDRWEPVEWVRNNGDGTVTCEFENIGPVAFCVPAEIPAAPEPAEEIAYPWIWVVLMILAFVLFLLLVLLRHRQKKEENA